MAQIDDRHATCRTATRQLTYEEVDTSLIPPRPRLYGLVGAEVIEEVWKERQAAKPAAATTATEPKANRRGKTATALAARVTAVSRSGAMHETCLTELRLLRVQVRDAHAEPSRIASGI